MEDDTVDRGTAAMAAFLMAAICGVVWGAIGITIGYLIWG